MHLGEILLVMMNMKKKINKVCIQLHMSYFNVSSLYYCTKDCTKFLMEYGLDSVIFESLKSGTQA